MTKRRFEITPQEGWMKWDIDDILYACIQHYATYNEKETVENHKLYLTKQSYLKNRASIRKMCGNPSPQTLQRHLNRLIDRGIIEEFTLSSGDYTYSCYGIVVNRDNPYKLVDNEWLFYLISTRNMSGIQIYFYLLDKNDWKPNYEFTVAELTRVLGYKTTDGTGAKMIGCILRSFAREGIIGYEEFYEEKIIDDTIVPSPKLRLTFLAKSEKELRKITN